MNDFLSYRHERRLSYFIIRSSYLCRHGFLEEAVSATAAAEDKDDPDDTSASITAKTAASTATATAAASENSVVATAAA